MFPDGSVDFIFKVVPTHEGPESGTANDLKPWGELALYTSPLQSLFCIKKRAKECKSSPKR